jgi:predicted ferric reductase
MLATASHSKEVWYLMRGTGLVSLVLLSLTVVGGIVNVKRFASSRWPRVITALLHRNVALLSVVFLGVHVLAAELDSYVSVGWWAAVVPFTSGWKPAWVGLGTLAIDCLLAIVITSLLRSRLSQRTWRAVHWLAYASWPLAVAHGFGAGSDSTTWWARSLYLLCIAAVGAAVVWRLRPSVRPARTQLGATRQPRNLVRTGATR